VPTELELDRLFWNAINANAEFFTWLLWRTKFSEKDLVLVTNEKWHQRWYRDPVTKKDSETDILLMLSEPTTGKRYALHIENKPDHRQWEPEQPENYRKRALDRMSKWRYDDFQTVLMAPRSFIAGSPAQAAQFDLTIPYEEVARFVPAFLVAGLAPC
jgi:hypothetical protein